MMNRKQMTLLILIGIFLYCSLLGSPLLGLVIDLIIVITLLLLGLYDTLLRQFFFLNTEERLIAKLMLPPIILLIIALYVDISRMDFNHEMPHKPTTIEETRPLNR